MIVQDQERQEQAAVGDLGIAEAASPISSPPPSATIANNNNLEEVIMRATTAEAGGASGKRWPRQETLALLQIRSEMDEAFRDAIFKAPLWEHVSRKLGEMGYKRSAKKCKEKFENVHKYYKRTKEGRGGCQDGKSYKFFTQLEALHHTHTTPTPIPIIPLSVLVSLPPPDILIVPPPHDHIAAAAGTRDHQDDTNINGISFSSDSSSYDDDDWLEEKEDEMELDDESADNQLHCRKRKRIHDSGAGMDDSDERMMDLFGGLVKQVMQKQEAMQQEFLEAIEKREQDRMIREEAWKRQDMARHARENDLMAQECAASVSRDAAIIAFLHKFTGQTIHLPMTIPQNSAHPVVTIPQQQQQSEIGKNLQPHCDPSHLQQPQCIDQTIDQLNNAFEIVAATPEQQMQRHDFTVGGSSLEIRASSRWPKAEVLALIQLRSRVESRYQEAGPKGQFWEEISACMRRMGYNNRSAKRCKEKWENINNYFKKVKEGNKQRHQDSKTCPYFHELDALYKKKVLSGNVIGGVSSGIFGTLSKQERQQQDVGMLQSLQGSESEDKDVRSINLRIY